MCWDLKNLSLNQVWIINKTVVREIKVTHNKCNVKIQNNQCIHAPSFKPNPIKVGLLEI